MKILWTLLCCLALTCAVFAQTTNDTPPPARFGFRRELAAHAAGTDTSPSARV